MAHNAALQEGLGSSGAQTLSPQRSGGCIILSPNCIHPEEEPQAMRAEGTGGRVRQDPCRSLKRLCQTPATALPTHISELFFRLHPMVGTLYFPRKRRNLQENFRRKRAIQRLCKNLIRDTAKYALKVVKNRKIPQFLKKRLCWQSAPLIANEA